MPASKPSLCFSAPARHARALAQRLYWKYNIRNAVKTIATRKPKAKD